MARYILQVGVTGGADWEKRLDKSDKNQLNKPQDYTYLQPETITKDVISLIDEDAKLTKYYEPTKQKLESKITYKLLVLGVGQHSKGQIRLLDEQGNEAREIAHIDKEPFSGQRRMNRLYIFDTEPKQVTFYNECLKHHKHFNQIDFDDNFAKIIVDFDH